MTEEDESSKRSGYGLDRVLAVSDGVFAFAVTLLVLDLAVQSGCMLVRCLENLRKSFDCS